jgi:DeoR/GlpR family transcriptional regulator of sugar metabolism
MLKKERNISVASLSSIFKVSEVTIRKDLEKLEAEGLLTRSHGGALINDDLILESTLLAKEDKFIHEKVAIASEAAKLITDNMTIALNAGTTTIHIAKKIKNRKNLNVVTNALNIAWELMDAPGVNIFLTGGFLKQNSYALVGNMVNLTLQGIFVDMAFIGVKGVSIKHGLTTSIVEEALVNQAMINVANKVAVVADHSKFDTVTFSLISTIDEIDMLITDDKAPVDQLQTLQEMGKTVIKARQS